MVSGWVSSRSTQRRRGARASTWRVWGIMSMAWIVTSLNPPCDERRQIAAQGGGVAREVGEASRP